MIPKKKLKRLTNDGLESDFMYSIRTIEFIVDYNYEELLTQFNTSIPGWHVNDILNNHTVYTNLRQWETVNTNNTVISVDSIDNTYTVDVYHQPRQSVTNISIDFNVTRNGEVFTS